MEFDWHGFWTAAIGGIFSAVTFFGLMVGLDSWDRHREAKRIEKEWCNCEK